MDCTSKPAEQESKTRSEEGSKESLRVTITIERIEGVRRCTMDEEKEAAAPSVPPSVELSSRAHDKSNTGSQLGLPLPRPSIRVPAAGFSGSVRIATTILNDDNTELTNTYKSPPFDITDGSSRRCGPLSVEVLGIIGRIETQELDFVSQIWGKELCISLIEEDHCDKLDQTSTTDETKQLYCGGRNTCRTLGITHIFVDNICGARTIAQPLVFNAGTKDAVLNGNIVITLAVACGSSSPTTIDTDETYLLAYKESITNLISVVEPQKLHAVDLRMSLSPDWESLVCELEDAAVRMMKNDGVQMQGAGGRQWDAKTLRVAVLEVEGPTEWFSRERSGLYLSNGWSFPSVVLGLGLTTRHGRIIEQVNAERAVRFLSKDPLFHSLKLCTAQEVAGHANDLIVSVNSLGGINGTDDIHVCKAVVPFSELKKPKTSPRSETQWIPLLACVPCGNHKDKTEKIVARVRLAIDTSLLLGNDLSFCDAPPFYEAHAEEVDPFQNVAISTSTIQKFADHKDDEDEQNDIIGCDTSSTCNAKDLDFVADSAEDVAAENALTSLACIYEAKKTSQARTSGEEFDSGNIKLTYSDGAGESTSGVEEEGESSANVVLLEGENISARDGNEQVESEMSVVSSSANTGEAMAIELGAEKGTDCRDAENAHEAEERRVIRPLEATFEVLGKPHIFSVTLRTFTEYLSPCEVDHSVRAQKMQLGVSACIRGAKIKTKTVRATRDSSSETKGGRYLFAGDKGITVDFPLASPCKEDALVLSIETRDGSFVGMTHVDVTRLLKAEPRNVLLPVCTRPSLTELQTRPRVAGFISLSICCKTWGRKFLEEEEEEDPSSLSESTYRSCLSLLMATRIADFYAEYLPERLHLVDFELLFDVDVDFEDFMTSMVSQYGPEPDVYPLHISVIRCDGLLIKSVTDSFRVEVCINGITYNSRQHGKQKKVARTTEKNVASTSNYSVVFDRRGLFDCFASRKDRGGGILVTLFRNEKEYGRCLLSSMNLPPQQTKRRTVSIVSAAGTDQAFVSGKMTIEFFTEGVGCLSIPNGVYEQRIRERISRLLLRFEPKLLHTVEHMMGEFVGDEDALIERLLAKYSCIPGDARLALTIKEIYGLDGFKNTKIAQIQHYLVKVKTHMEKLRTRPSDAEGVFDDTLLFTMAKPEKDNLHVFVYASDYGGAMELLGEAVVSIGNLQVETARSLSIMLVRKANTKHAVCAGYLRIMLRSDQFGSYEPVNVASELAWRQRFQNFFLRSCREKLHRIHAVPPLRSYMDKLVRTHGPEPFWNEVGVTICECQDVLNYFDSAAVTLANSLGISFTTRDVQSQGNVVHYNEAFRFFIFTDGDSEEEGGELSLKIWQQTEDGARKELGRATVPLLVLLSPYMYSRREDELGRWIDIISDHPTTNTPFIAGSLRMKMTWYATNEAKANPTVRLLCSEPAVNALRRELEMTLAAHAPTELHRISCWMAKEKYAISEKIQQFSSSRRSEGLDALGKGKTTSSEVSFTVRVRGLQTIRKGHFQVRVAAANGASLLTTQTVRTSPHKFAPSNGNVACWLGQLFDAVHEELSFTLFEATPGGIERVGVSRIKLAHCADGKYNYRCLPFFQNRIHVANVSADVRIVSATVTPNVDVSENGGLWENVSTDVCSLLAKYEPAELERLDSIVRESANLSALHANLLSKIADKHSVRLRHTLYFDNISVDLAWSTDTAARCRSKSAFSIEIRATKSGVSEEIYGKNDRYVSDSAPLSLEEDLPERLPVALLATNLIETTPRRVLVHAEKHIDESRSDQPFSVRLVPEIETLRLDLQEAALISVRVLAKNDSHSYGQGKPLPMGEACIPYDELIDSEAGCIYELTLLGHDGSTNVAKVSFTHSLPL